MIKTREIEKYLQYGKKIRVLKYAQDFGARDACETFGITKTTFYNWKNNFNRYGEKGLERKIGDPKTYGNRLDSKVIELILELRKQYKLGTWRIQWYLERYHDINVSESSVYRTLKGHNVKSLDKITTRKAMGPKRYAKETSGHHVQVAVKFLVFNPPKGKKQSVINTLQLMIALE